MTKVQVTVTKYDDLFLRWYATAPDVVPRKGAFGFSQKRAVKNWMKEYKKALKEQTETFEVEV